MVIYLENAKGSAGRKLPVRELKKTARRILELLNQNQAELSIALVKNREIQQLNTRYRHKNEPTDVLSFPSGGGPAEGMAPPGGCGHLGRAGGKTGKRKGKDANGGNGKPADSRHPPPPGLRP